ncbi:amylopullulanase [Saccharibacillus sp. O16]|nr:amylopullulanase [Saccharibacillus sp. O16]
MNMNRKSISSVLAVSVLSLSLGSQLFAAGAGFGDLQGVKDAGKIDALKSEGLLKGVSATTFHPNSVLTNAQGIQLIAGGLQLSLAAITFEAGKVPTAHDLFPAIDNKAWYAEAFVNASFNGVDIPKSIDPTAKMTKEAYVSSLMQALEKTGNLPMIKVAPQPLPDEDQITPEYQGAIQRALSRGLVSLDEGGKFNPKSEITRAEAAVMLYDGIEYLKELSDAPAPDSNGQPAE